MSSNNQPTSSSSPQSSFSSSTSQEEALVPLPGSNNDSNDKNDEDKTTTLLLPQTVSQFLDDCDESYLEILTIPPPPSSSLVTTLLSTTLPSPPSSASPPPVDKFLSTLIDQLQPSFSSPPSSSSRFTIVQSLSLLHNFLLAISISSSSSEKKLSLSDSYLRLLGQFFISHSRRSHHPDSIRDVAILSLATLLRIPTIVSLPSNLPRDASDDRLNLALSGAATYAGDDDVDDDDVSDESHISTLRRAQRSRVISLLSLPPPPYPRRHVRYVLRCLRGETDPRCLLAALRLLARDYDDDVALRRQVFDAVSVYYPVTFTPPPDDVVGITREDLETALFDVLWPDDDEDRRRWTWELFVGRLEGEDDDDDDALDIAMERREALRDMTRVASSGVVMGEDVGRRCGRALFRAYGEGVAEGRTDVVRLARRVAMVLQSTTTTTTTGDDDLSRPAREALAVLKRDRWSDEKGVALTYLASLLSNDASLETICGAVGEALLELRGDDATKEALFAVGAFIQPRCRRFITTWEERIVAMVVEKWDEESVACARLLERWVAVVGRGGDVVETLTSRAVAALDDEDRDDGSWRKAYADLVGSYWSLPSAGKTTMATLEDSILSSSSKSSWVDVALTKCCTLSSSACQLILSTLWKECLGSLKFVNDERMETLCQRLVYIMSHDNEKEEEEETIIKKCWTELLDDSVTDLLTAWIPKVEDTITTTTTSNDVSLTRLELPPNDDERRRIDNLITTRHNSHAPLLPLLSLSSSSTKLSSSTLSLLLPSLPPLSSHDHINISLLLPLLDAPRRRRRRQKPLSLSPEISKSLAMTLVDIILDNDVYNSIATRRAAMQVFEDVITNGMDDDVRGQIWEEGIKEELKSSVNDMGKSEGYWEDIMALVAIMGCIASPRGGFSSPIAMTTSNDILSVILDCVTKPTTSKDLLPLRAATTFGCLLSHNPSNDDDDDSSPSPLWKQRLACKALAHLRRHRERVTTLASDAVVSYIACHLPRDAFSIEDWTFMYHCLIKRLVVRDDDGGGDDEDVRTLVLSCLVKMMSFSDVMVVMNNDDSLLTALRHVLIPTTTNGDDSTTSQSLLALQCLKNLYPHDNNNDNPRRKQDRRWAVLSILDAVVNHKTRIVRLAAVELRNLWGL